MPSIGDSGYWALAAFPSPLGAQLLRLPMEQFGRQVSQTTIPRRSEQEQSIFNHATQSPRGIASRIGRPRARFMAV